MNTLIIDHRMRNDEKKILKSIGYNLIELPEMKMCIMRYHHMWIYLRVW